MEAKFIIGIVALLALVAMGVVVLSGKGDWMISGYNTASSEGKAKYNLKRLRLVMKGG
ncbi:MAG: DUF3784 domain-containing protein [Bacteroidales bacterium]|nr:DUF3784 domain-containing protein [Bacteroidales bacterium]